ncbi:MAG: hypothetical protein E6J00_01965 [Chloroflexi bacterium]|nr:MAG: hypothetical protein E6J00_01965 [Chloroflexota bacterium]
MNAAAGRVLLIGLDCLGPEVLDPARGLMPSLAALAQRHPSGTLLSTLPPITVPAWTSMLTGCDPGGARHLELGAAPPGLGPPQPGRTTEPGDRSASDQPAAAPSGKPRVRIRGPGRGPLHPPALARRRGRVDHRRLSLRRP